MNFSERRNASNTMAEKHLTFKKADFSNLKMVKEYKEGVETFYLDSWEQFYNDLLHIMNQGEENIRIMKHYLWRGHRRDDCKLSSLFDRWYEKKVANRNEKHRKSLLKRRLEIFRAKLNEATGIQYPEENNYWALAQHHGLYTPLLDWTEDPYIAAYFAFYKELNADQTLCRVIYGLSTKIQILLRKMKKKTKNKKTKKVISEKVVQKERFIKILNRCDVGDSIMNKRLECQIGRFTRALNGDDIETNVRRLLRKRPDITSDNKIILFKILIPNQERNKALKWLKEKKDIYHTKLFPDNSGAVEACEMELGIN